VTLVDARSLAEDFELGERLVDLDEGDQEAALLVAQLQLATVILLTKTDKVSAQLVERIGANLTQVNPAARLYNVQYGKIAPDLVLDLGGLHPVALQEISDSGSNCDIGSIVISDPRPLHPERLWKVYREQLGLGIHRSKGFLWLPSRDQDVLLWNQCGGMVEMELTVPAVMNGIAEVHELRRGADIELQALEDGDDVITGIAQCPLHAPGVDRAGAGPFLDRDLKHPRAAERLEAPSHSGSVDQLADQ
jgi:G3E family GTPase